MTMEVPSPVEVLLEMAERADAREAELLNEAVDTYLSTEDDQLSPQSIEHAAEFCERHEAPGGFSWLGQAASYLTSYYSVLSVWHGLDLIDGN